MVPNRATHHIYRIYSIIRNRIIHFFVNVSFYQHLLLINGHVSQRQAFVDTLILKCDYCCECCCHDVETSQLTRFYMIAALIFGQETQYHLDDLLYFQISFLIFNHALFFTSEAAINICDEKNVLKYLEKSQENVGRVLFLAKFQALGVLGFRREISRAASFQIFQMSSKQKQSFKGVL